MKIKLSALLFFIVFIASGQSDKKEGYKILQTIKAPFLKKLKANELMLSPDNHYLLVNYGNKPTYIIFFDTATWQKAEEYKLPDWVEFGSSYFDATLDFLYVKTSRFSSDYYRIQRSTKIIDTVECVQAPKGCGSTDVKIDLKELYSTDKFYYFQINKKNNRDIFIYTRENKNVH